ncbi:unnamed protein product [Urochloa humidicola]
MSLELEALRSNNISLKKTIYQSNNMIDKLQADYGSLQQAHDELQAEHEKTKRMLRDYDVETLKNLSYIKELGEKYAELEKAVKIVADSINVEVPGAEPRPLIDRLSEAPKKFAVYVKETCLFLANQVFGIVQSFYRNAEFKDVPKGKVMNCTEDQFKQLLEKRWPIAKEVIEKLELFD